MEKPDLNRMWEAFIKIPNLTQMWDAFQKNPNKENMVRINNCVFNMIRFKIYPMISQLKSKGIINWYHFLIHNRESGVPSTKDDNNVYFHIRFSLKEDVAIKRKKDANNFLPDNCEKHMTRQYKGVKISGIDKSLLKNEQIEEAWRIIGEQSEWLIEMLNIHKEDVDIPYLQVEQFLHFYFNMTQVVFMCPCCKNIFHSGAILFPLFP